MADLRSVAPRFDDFFKICSGKAFDIIGVLEVRANPVEKKGEKKVLS